VIHFYDRVHDAIRKIDEEHILFWDGNTFASDFSHFGDAHKRWRNSAYAIHDYSNFGFPGASEVYSSTETQKARLQRSYDKKAEWMHERGLCIWNGEFGPVYAREQYDGDKTDEINASRYKLLKDQLAIYDKERVSWTIWLYKDIGYQGMTYVSRDTPYMKLFEKFLAKKQRLAVDAWGADDSQIRNVFGPLEDWFSDNVEDQYRILYPMPVWRFKERVSRISRCIAMAEFMVDEWAEHFRGKSEAELDEIAKSFLFENCMKREGLNEVLREHRGLPKV